MKLFYSQAACSLAPHIALHEAGLKFTLEGVNLQTKQSKVGDFNKINPKGYVPTLELDDGQILTEVAVILQYIAEKAPEKQLMPKSGMERFRCLEWLNYVATELHKGWGPLWNPKMPADMKEMTKGLLAKKFDFLTKSLEGKKFLMGDQYTVADPYMFTVLNWGAHTGVDLTKWPALLGHQERMRSRPAVQAALKDEGLLK